MMKVIKYIGVVCMLSVLAGCVDDKTIDEFKVLNQVTIEGLQERYSVLLYNRLQCTPVIRTSQNDESNLSYVWYAYTTTTRNEADTLGLERELDVLAERSILTPGEAYTLALKVTDNTTGVFYREERELEVRTQFTKGTVLLCEENGLAEVNFIPDDESNTVLEDVYESANKQLLGRNPTRIFSVNPNAYATFLKQELIFCRDENGGVVASPLSFEKIKTMREACDHHFEASEMSPELYYKGGMIDYIIVNGMVCKRATNMQAINWEPGLVLMNEPREYQVAPHVLAVGSNPVFFDELYGRFIVHNPWNQGSLKKFSKADNDPGIFDGSNLGTGLELKCWGPLSEAKLGAWMLLLNKKDGKYWMYKFSLLNNSFRSISKTEVTAAVAPHLHEAIGFAANPEYEDVLMYATENAVYSFAVNQLNASTSSSLEVLQKDMQAIENMQVTGIQFVDITVPAPTESDPSATRISQQVRLAVRDLNRTERQGGVVFYEVNSTGGIHLDSVFKKTGFCDKVIDINEKYE